jgi:hypothetical protein
VSICEDKVSQGMFMNLNASICQVWSDDDMGVLGLLMSFAEVTLTESPE